MAVNNIFVRWKNVMDKIFYTEINAICIIFLLFIVSNNKNNFKNMMYEQRIFDYTVIADILVLIFDGMMWIMDGLHFMGAGIIYHVSSILYFIMNAVLCACWAAYVDYRINQDRKKLRQRMPFYIFPVVINSIIAVLSPITGWYYVIDKNNIYHRGQYVYLTFLVGFLCLIQSIYMIASQVKKKGWIYDKFVYVHLAIFPTFIVVATVIQLTHFRLSIIWVCSALALLNIYMHMQNDAASMDYLTKLYNKRQLDASMKLKLQNNKENMFLLIIDMDDFKLINDTYGHTVGDEALKKAAGILKKCSAGNDDVIARIGGDEFAILGERKQREEVELIIEKIGEEAAAFNENNKQKYKLSFSIGKAFYEENKSQNRIMMDADKDMYHNKKTKKDNR